MKLEDDSGVGLTPGFRGSMRHSRAVTGHEAVKADSRRCRPKVVLPETLHVKGATPVLAPRAIHCLLDSTFSSPTALQGKAC